MTSLCIMKRGYNEIFSLPLACPMCMKNYSPTLYLNFNQIYSIVTIEYICFNLNVSLDAA